MAQLAIDNRHALKALKDSSFFKSVAISEWEDGFNPKGKRDILENRFPLIAIDSNQADQDVIYIDEPTYYLQGNVEDSLCPIINMKVNGSVIPLNPWNGRFEYRVNTFGNKTTSLSIRAVDEFSNTSIRKLTFIRKSSSPFIDLMATRKDFALLIANEHYESGIDSLRFPVENMIKFQEILVDKYNFDTNCIITRFNLSRRQVINLLDSLRISLTQKDQLIIYYAGHSYYDSSYKEAYWFLSDAIKSERSTWYSNNDLITVLKSFKTNHLLLLADACNSGYLIEASKTRNILNDPQFANLFVKPSKQIITSTNFSETPDESFFAETLLNILKNNKEPYLSASDLHSYIYREVKRRIGKEPQIGTIGNGSDSGQYYFILPSVR